VRIPKYGFVHETDRQKCYGRKNTGKFGVSAIRIQWTTSRTALESEAAAATPSLDEKLAAAVVAVDNASKLVKNLERTLARYRSISSFQPGTIDSTVKMLEQKIICRDRLTVKMMELKAEKIASVPFTEQLNAG